MHKLKKNTLKITFNNKLLKITANDFNNEINLKNVFPINVFTFFLFFVKGF